MLPPLNSDIWQQEQEVNTLGNCIDKLYDVRQIIKDLSIVNTNLQEELKVIYIKLFDLWKKENERVQALRSQT